MHPSDRSNETFPGAMITFPGLQDMSHVYSLVPHNGKRTEHADLCMSTWCYINNRISDIGGLLYECFRPDITIAAWMTEL